MDNFCNLASKYFNQYTPKEAAILIHGNIFKIYLILIYLILKSFLTDI